MIRIRPLSLCLALALASVTGTSFAATDTATDSRPQTDQHGGKTAGEDSSVNSPGSSKTNDSSDTGSNSDASACGYPARAQTDRLRRTMGTDPREPRSAPGSQRRLRNIDPICRLVPLHRIIELHHMPLRPAKDPAQTI